MPLLRLVTLAGIGLVAAGTASAETAKNDYPTVDRVLYVQACMEARPGGHFYEMVNKCSCVIDTLAKEISYDDYVTMTTMVNALSIGGDRGGVIRDNAPAMDQIKHYRALQTQAQKGCFLEPGPR